MGGGCLLVAIESLISPGLRDSTGYEELEGGVEGEESIPRRPHRLFGAADADETTPLISRENEAHTPRGGDVDGKAEDDVEPLSTWWWIPQFLLSVPIPIILFGHVTMLLLDSMPQTLADGASPWNGAYFGSNHSCSLSLLTDGHPSISAISLYPHLSSGSTARSSASAVRIQAPPISTSDHACLVNIYPDNALRPSYVPVLHRVPFENLLPATRPIPLRPCPFEHGADAHVQPAKSDHIPHGTGALPALLSHSLPAVVAGGWEGHSVYKGRVKGRPGDV